MKKITLKMQQEPKACWRYKWPLKRTAKWPNQYFLARRQQHELKMWLSHVKNPNGEGKRSGRGLVD
jgi:hypothetical protein